MGRGKNEMIRQIEPSTILIYGGNIDTETKGINTIWYENKTIKRLKESELKGDKGDKGEKKS